MILPPKLHHFALFLAGFCFALILVAGIRRDEIGLTLGFAGFFFDLLYYFWIEHFSNSNRR